MVCKRYLAVTEKEIGNISGPVAWMACRFAQKHPGLDNLPSRLPEGSLIILDDLQPISGHSPARIARQLETLCRQHRPAGILLDLQRKKTPQAMQMVKALLQIQETPIALTAEYAREFSCPVLVTAPMHQKLQQVIAPWKNREIWLDIPMGQVTIRQGKLTDEKATHTGNYQWDRFLCCGYAKTGQDTYALCRNKAMLPKILEEAARLGIPKALLLASEI